MKNLGGKIFILCGLLPLAGCETWQNPGPQPQAKIIATYDATYVKPVGDSVEHMVPGGPTIDKTSADRLTILEQRVDALQNQVDSMLGRGAAAGHTDAPADHGPPSGMIAPPPDSVQPMPLSPPGPGAGNAADGSPVALTAAPLVDQKPAKGGVIVQALRVGEHPGVTRIVLDSSKKSAFSTDIDNDEHILTVEVSGAGWTAGKGEHKTPRSPLLASWQAAPDGKGGTRFALQLRKNAKIVSKQALPAGPGKPARIVIDLAAA